MNLPLPPADLLGLVGLLLLVLGIAVAASARRSAHLGRLRAVDAVGHPAPVLRAPRWKLAGRPDMVREAADGTLFPVELKSGPAPRRGPPRSHRVQVEAYCLLLEEATGRSPPFGVLRYGDGEEFRVPWGARERAELWALRRELDRPYDGRATPSAGRCGRCRWRGACDRRAL